MRKIPNGYCLLGDSFMNEVFFVAYKNRTPDPGVCKVLACNWEKRKLEVINGAVRLYPSFDEVLPVMKV